ncbi:major facilitator superfamily domain-containing protein [Infundibulicybe gibba]|nr:major facilitator superfamily domain-containing protein [Infundibulicybe gibba]
MKSSLLFAGSTCGFAIGTLVVESVMNHLGRIPLHHKGPFASNGSSAYGYSASRARHLTLILGSVLHACFFIIMGSRGGFPALFMAYVVAAFARAFLTGPSSYNLTAGIHRNSYCALKGKQVIGYAFGLWSFGGVISPLVCQSVISTGVPWFQFYFGSLVLSGINAAFLGCTFKPTMKESTEEHQQAMNEAFPPEQSPSGSCTPTDYFSKGSPQLDNESKPNDSLRRALSMRYQWAFSLFAWLYCGSETTTQGFMVLYLLAARNANPKTVGYVTSGFWGGITVGRFLWGYFSPSLTFTQKKYLVHVSISVALVMHLLIWFVNSNIENAFSTSIIGLLYGPIFPACLDLATSILPPDVHMVAMALISSFASLGSAMFPFMAGSIASVKGIQSMTYVTVPQAAVMVTIWFFFPSKIPGRNV